MFDSQNGGAPSLQSPTHGHGNDDNGGETDDTTTPLASPRKQNLSPLTPQPQNLPLTQASANQSPCPPNQSSQVSPCLSLGQSEERDSDTTLKSMLRMAQSVLSRVAEAADLPVAHTDEQLTDALSRAVTDAQRLHDALLAASAALF